MTDEEALTRSIGQRFRSIRLQQRQTLQTMARALDVSYQQIRKYETGQNRISASTLYRAACVLGVDVARFFDDPARTAEAAGGDRKAENDDLARALNRIDDPHVRRRLVDLISILDTKS